jgi:hypothetical protein
MAVTHSGAAKDAATNAVIALIGTGAHLKYHITGSTVGTPSTTVATLTMTSNANGGFTAASGATTGIATAGTITADTNAAGGVIAFASIQTSGNVAIIHCAVSTTGSDINITTGGLTVASGDTVTCTSLTYAALSA